MKCFGDILVSSARESAACIMYEAAASLGFSPNDSPSSFPFRMLAEPVSPSASMSVSLSPSPSPLTSSLASTAEPRPNLTAAECGGPITEEDEERYKEIW